MALAYLKDFRWSYTPCNEETHAPLIELGDLSLQSIPIPQQMEATTVESAYTGVSGYVEFRDGSFGSDGSTLSFNTSNGTNGGALKGWAYDLRAHRLESGPIQPFTQDLHVVGKYRIDQFRTCKGCNDTLTAISIDAPVNERPIVITRNLSSVAIATTDGSAVLWGEVNSKDQPLFGIYDLATRHKSYFISLTGGGLLAARKNGSGYLVAYEADGESCAPSVQTVVNLMENQHPPNVRRSGSVCFVKLPNPSLKTAF